MNKIRLLNKMDRKIKNIEMKIYKLQGELSLLENERALLKFSTLPRSYE
jgi:hypothetical protein